MQASRIVFFWSLISICVFASIAWSQPTFDKPIILGQTCALSGPAKNLGIELRAGLQAAFEEANLAGGVNGREIILISKDDGYEPYRAVENARELIEHENVFMLIGSLGTPTAQAVLPLVEEFQIPFFAPFTGAEFLRKPHRKLVVNIRGSYHQEMEEIVAYLVDTLKFKRIACFYQNDSFGQSGLVGLQKALQKRGLEMVSSGSYERNTVAILGGLHDVYRDRPEAVVIVGAYPASGEFIKLSKLRIGKEIVFANLSFVGSKSLQKTLGEFAGNVVVSQVVPYPWDYQLPIIRDYQQSLRLFRQDATPGFTSLEGYIAGRLFYTVARLVEGELTRESFLKTLMETGRFDIGGVIMEFGQNDLQGTDEIYLTKIYPSFEVIVP